jgi:hypothetical protein
LFFRIFFLKNVIFIHRFYARLDPRSRYNYSNKNMKDSLILEGKIYISAKRAAKIINYAQDYIGQLCRSGKLDSKMIGRSWYVTEESLLAHREQAVDATQERVLKVTKGITPENAAEVEPVVERKIQVVSESVPSPIVASDPVVAPTKIPVVAASIFPVKSEVIAPVAPVSTFKYEVENKPALPEITKKVPASFSISKKATDLTATPFASKLTVKNSDAASVRPSRSLSLVSSQISPVQIKLPSEIVKAQNLRAALERSEKDERAKVAAEARAQRIANERIAAEKVAAEKAAAAAAAAAAQTPVTAPAPRVAPRPVISPIQNVVSKIQSEPKVAVLTLTAPKSIALGIAAILVVVSGLMFTVAGQNIKKAALGSNSAASITSNFFSGIFRTLGFGKPATLATIPRSPEVNNNPNPETVSPFNGISVVPSTGSAAADQAAKQKIQTSFSDEVSIQPDDSGTAGVITPVFKKGSGDDFMYVLVPVKEKKQ